MAERAHIIAHSDGGPRADPSLPAELRNDPENIVLLCPLCHTMADKAPESYPTDSLSRRKSIRREAVARIGGTPVFTDRGNARRAAERLLERNRLLFRQYGPNPKDGATSSKEEAMAWSERVVDEIVPNNRLLIALVDVNASLAVPADREAAELLRQHTDDLERKHATTHAITGPAARFPKEAENLFQETEP